VEDLERMVNGFSLPFSLNISALNILGVWTVLCTYFIIQGSSLSTVSRPGLDGQETGLRLQASYRGCALNRLSGVFLFSVWYRRKTFPLLKQPAHKDDHFELVPVLKKVCKNFPRNETNFMLKNHKYNKRQSTKFIRLGRSGTKDFYAPG
jgi:hypothetical protein